MYEHPSFATIVSRLSVRISVQNGKEGTGTIYRLKSDEDRLCIITAKHCIVDANNSLRKLQDITIHQNGTGKYYHLNDGDQVVVHPEVDFAIILVSQKELSEIFGDFPDIMLAEDHAGERELFFYGYPMGSEHNTAVRVNGTLLPPISGGVINIESDLKSELNLTENTVVGLSGSGIILKCGSNIYLLGIILKFEEWGRFSGTSIKYLNALLVANNLLPEPLSILEGNPELIKAFQILKGNSESLLGNISDSISGIHIDRSRYIQKASSLLTQTNVLLISGIAGAGKSTFSKALLRYLETERNAKVISFYGTQVCKASSAELLSLLGITSTMGDLLKSRDLSGLKIIYIDSAEKGFEHSQIEVIKELLKLTLTYSELKIILSVRSYALTMSTFGMFSSVSVPWSKLDIDLLTDQEMLPVTEAFPKLQSWMKNPKIESFVRTPFYLNFLVTVINDVANEELDELKLKNLLWENVIRKDNVGRENLFQYVALTRAKLMSPYVKLQENTDALILLNLLSDHLLKENVDVFGLRTYAPAHDILEDWALVRHMRATFETATSLEMFLLEIGSSYSMRRGFRFWLQEIYRVDVKSAQTITLETLTMAAIGTSWKDEVIIAMLNSKVCSIFLNANQDILMANNASLLIRCIHLLRTSCKAMQGYRVAENFLDEREYMTSDILTSTGPGWNAMVNFITTNYAELTSQHFLIIQLLLDWGKQEVEIDQLPSANAFKLITQLLKNYSKGFVNRRNDSGGNITTNLLKLLFKLVGQNKSDFEAFVRESFQYVRDLESRVASSDEELPLDFHQKVLELCLDYYSSEQVCRFLPELVWEIAQYSWTDTAENEAKAKYRNVDRGFPRLSQLINFEREPEMEELFGLSSEGKRDFYPESALQTPLPYLLKYHAELSVDQFSSFINRSINTYRGLSKDELVEVELILNDGSRKKVYGNSEIWRMYRGSHRCPKLLNCLHMALENHLLELGTQKTDASRQELERIVTQLFSQNISVSVSATIASVAVAYPFAVGMVMLPAFSFKEAFRWDLQRRISERDIFTPPDMSGKHPRAQRERINSKNLAHRNQTLDFLILKMSFYEGFSERIAEFIEMFNNTLVTKGSKDWDNWPYVLIRIDRAKYQVTETTEVGVIIAPQLPEPMKAELEEARKSFEGDSGITVWNWCHLILDKNQFEDNTYENWLRFSALSKELLETDSMDNRMYNSPTAVAEIGLTYYRSRLSQQEFDWCIDIVFDAAEFFIEQENERFNTGFGRYSTWNKEVVFKFLPSLLGASYAMETAQRAQIILNKAIHLFGIDDGLKKPLFEKIAGGCWNNDMEFAIKCFNELVLNAIEPNWRNKEAPPEMDWLNDLKFNHSRNCLFNLDKAFLFLSETSELDANGYLFLSKYQQFLIENTWNDLEKQDRRQRSEYFEGSLHFQFKYGKIVLEHEGIEIDKLFVSLMDSLLSITTENSSRISNESIELVAQSFKNIFDHEDKNLKTSRFIKLWEIVLYKTLKTEKTTFIKYLLLDWYWRDSADSWPVIKQNVAFFLEIVRHLGINDLPRTIGLIGGIGFEDLFPDSLQLFKSLIESIDKDNWTTLYSTEKYIQRVYFRKGNLVKADKEASRNFVFILDKMINAGSSVAFLVKETFVSA
ncbi:P-loop NTPase family protein [Pedobacter gandavensis]|uniref:ATP-binding protein n=1 Tax=Pedobacter gandavensis TaxID=2679963 RepID=A0ABR6F333_9SPHI|nr:hypothetical protein [Pedobacter gandavensis]MBB2151636.1 hypothetical protein [Pedobacter gandavensis]